MHAVRRDVLASLACRGRRRGGFRSGRPPPVFIRAHASATSRARGGRFACRARRTARATQACASQV
ncbi:hypothetical protein C6P97_08390 [Burkholderia multivorans]|uniref:Uncharacterized protein n=1 Tax=Burkholderia multivorans TaxID=87883 RepID=A0AB37AT09_9BURK|nr:hypothetical protein C6P99_16545 [Burkholderia multivorans]PRE51854.1 hypothetical protein C6P97_08390 [Burkholderia multivorans]